MSKPRSKVTDIFSPRTGRFIDFLNGLREDNIVVNELIYNIGLIKVTKVFDDNSVYGDCIDEFNTNTEILYRPLFFDFYNVEICEGDVLLVASNEEKRHGFWIAPIKAYIDGKTFDKIKDGRNLNLNLNKLKINLSNETGSLQILENEDIKEFFENLLKELIQISITNNTIIGIISTFSATLSSTQPKDVPSLTAIIAATNTTLIQSLNDLNKSINNIYNIISTLENKLFFKERDFDKKK